MPLAAAAGATLVASAEPPAETAAAPPAVDLGGRPFDPFGDRAARAVVLVFAGPECPVSNRQAPALGRLHRDFAPRGVRFYLVYSEVEVGPEDARRHHSDYRYPFPALLDHGRALTALAGAEVLSEVAVFSPAGELLYRGRIDDRAADLGAMRREPTREDLRAALEDVLAGRPVAEPRTRAVGCLIPPLERAAP